MTKILYFNHAEGRVSVEKTVKGAINHNAQFIEYQKGKLPLSNLLGSGCDIMLSHDDSIRKFLDDGILTHSVTNQEKRIIVIAFSGAGIDLMPKEFGHVDSSGQQYVIYGLGIRKPASSSCPTDNEWKQLLEWATSLSQAVKKEHVNLSQIVTDMPPVVRQLLAPAPYPEALVAAYLLLLAKSKSKDMDISFGDEKLWEEAGEQYPKSDDKEKIIDWSACASGSPEEQASAIPKLKKHFSDIAARS